MGHPDDANEIECLYTMFKSSAGVAYAFIEAKLKDQRQPFGACPFGHKESSPFCSKLLRRINKLPGRNENDKYALLAALQDKFTTAMLETRETETPYNPFGLFGSFAEAE